MVRNRTNRIPRRQEAESNQAPYFPAVLGLYQCPTIVNNVETLCNVRHIMEMGGDEFSKIEETAQEPESGAFRVMWLNPDITNLNAVR